MAYTEQKVFDRLAAQGAKVLTVQANGGTVAVEVEHATGVWVVSDTLAEDGAYELSLLGKLPVRISPTGGASWALH